MKHTCCRRTRQVWSARTRVGVGSTLTCSCTEVPEHTSAERRLHSSSLWKGSKASRAWSHRSQLTWACSAVPPPWPMSRPWQWLQWVHDSNFLEDQGIRESPKYNRNFQILRKIIKYFKNLGVNINMIYCLLALSWTNKSRSGLNKKYRSYLFQF